ncbi:MAG: ATP-binding cassette domain-containing protein [Mailhella sp.]|nr:ATP-binding cassette domain-containing protein [Mailhella sp.]
MNAPLRQTAENAPLLQVEDLKVHFPVRRGFLRQSRLWVKAVDGVSFSIGQGETFSLVGESGCGKSTTGYAILGMVKPTSGVIRFQGKTVTGDEEDAHAVRRQMQIVFQDPFASLDPKMSIGESICEPLRASGMADPAERRSLAEQMLEMVGLHASYYGRLPNQFSGGQRQRIVIARALAMKPKLIVCDEPVSALDVSIRSQILNLLLALQKELGVAYLFISHDLSVVRHISDRIAVMYLGHIVELAETAELFRSALHPYTQALFSAIPLPDPSQKGKRRIILQGDLPSPLSPPSGCPLVTRCPHKTPHCSESMPELKEVISGHSVACHRVSV